MLSRGAFLTATLLGVAIGLAFGHDFSTSWEPSISALHGTNFTPFHRNFAESFAVKRLHNAAGRPCCLSAAGGDADLGHQAAVDPPTWSTPPPLAFEQSEFDHPPTSLRGSEERGGRPRGCGMRFPCCMRTASSEDKTLSCEDKAYLTKITIICRNRDGMVASRSRDAACASRRLARDHGALALFSRRGLASTPIPHALPHPHLPPHAPPYFRRATCRRAL